jgi:hypothetical protein
LDSYLSNALQMLNPVVECMNDPAYVRDKKSTPKSRRGLAAIDPGEAVDPLDALGQIGKGSTG